MPYPDSDCNCSTIKTTDTLYAVACEDIEADTVLFTVPRSVILSSHTSGLAAAIPGIFDPGFMQTSVDTDEMDTDDFDDDEAHDSWSILILVLIYEYLLGDKSRWGAYINILPREFDTPMFWTADEVNELQASPLVNRIGKTDADALIMRKVVPIVRQYQNVFFGGGQTVLSDDEILALAHRMGSTIMAYAFDLEKDDEEKGETEDGWTEDKEGRGLLGMVPMADLLNANAQFNVSSSDVAKHIGGKTHLLTRRT